MIEITTLVKANGPLTKRISLGPDGAVVSDGSACVMSEGTALRTVFEDLGSFAEHIDGMAPDEAITLGRLRDDQPDLCKVRTKRKLNGEAAPGIIARSSEYIAYKTGQPAFALIDIDLKAMPNTVRGKIKAAGGFWAALVSVLPDLENVARVIRRSTSAGLHRTDTGEGIPGSGGIHIFVLVEDGGDIDRFLKVLHARCWLHGFGWGMVSEAGSFLERSLVDRSVGSGERLVFEAAPVVVAPVAQDQTRREPVVSEGVPLDTARACPPLSPAEKVKLRKLITAETNRLADELAAARTAFVTKHGTEISRRTGKSQAESEEIALKWAKGVLSPDVVLLFDDADLAGSTVADVLADPGRFEDATLADPIAGLEYGRGKAKILRRRGGTMFVNSFAHGGITYELKGDDAPPPDWLGGTLRGDRGEVLAILANAAHALRKASELSGLVIYNEMARAVLVTRNPPDSKLKSIDAPQPIADADVTAIQEWSQHHGLPRVGREVVQQAVDIVARENGFHPVVDYLNALQWDGIERLYRWLTDYLGADNTPYTQAVGQMFLVGMVSRIMRPGEKLDYMPILEGPQGIGKSRVCAVLGGPWFSDALPDIKTSDPVRLSMHLRGKWLIEISEMSAMSRSESEDLKAFLTRTQEIYTPKYGHNEVIEPRQCCFIGTTNKKAYLKDETGARRFWPVKVGPIAIDALTADRDQLLAEAVHAFHAGSPVFPDEAFERDHIRPEQEDRYDANAWEELIETYLAGRLRTTVADLAREALGFQTDKIGTADQRRIINVLERAGWQRGKREATKRWWVKSLE